MSAVNALEVCPSVTCTTFISTRALLERGFPTIGEHADGAHADHDLAGWMGVVGNLAPTSGEVPAKPARVRDLTSVYAQNWREGGSMGRGPHDYALPFVRPGRLRGETYRWNLGASARVFTRYAYES